MTQKVVNIFHHIPFVYPLTNLSRVYKKNLKIVNTMCEDVIKSRREQILQKSKLLEVKIGEKSNERLAFLDLLLQAKRVSGRHLTDKEIRDQVITFMTAVSFSSSSFQA